MNSQRDAFVKAVRTSPPCPAKLRWLRDLLAEEGRVPASFDPAALIDASIRKKAAARLAQIH